MKEYEISRICSGNRLPTELQAAKIAQAVHRLVADLFPRCRSVETVDVSAMLELAKAHAELVQSQHALAHARSRIDALEVERKELLVLLAKIQSASAIASANASIAAKAATRATSLSTRLDGGAQT